MKRKVGRRRGGARKMFLLPQILPMRPYIVRVMADLRTTRHRMESLVRLAKAPRSHESQDYAQRRRRHDATEQLAKLRSEEQGLIREFKKLGIRIGNVDRGEMLFPCLVDSQDAYFVWYLDEPRPTHWRFQGDGDPREIPEAWFNLYSTERKLRKIERWL